MHYGKWCGPSLATNNGLLRVARIHGPRTWQKPPWKIEIGPKPLRWPGSQRDIGKQQEIELILLINQKDPLAAAPKGNSPRTDDYPKGGHHQSPEKLGLEREMSEATSGKTGWHSTEVSSLKQKSAAPRRVTCILNAQTSVTMVAS
ncbi:hypothetical protein DFH07DRAFT_769502 [Mycena maculata]|uniref:Uncharacterized protein n=1 Tax=Mycena maculata TaxID=230809 RepID=A0AAD7NM07_9AGAR|nr:hypothetical protein DFH07DRAFT_769502 [Mycena maculata]